MFKLVSLIYVVEDSNKGACRG